MSEWSFDPASAAEAAERIRRRRDLLAAERVSKVDKVALEHHDGGEQGVPDRVEWVASLLDCVGELIANAARYDQIVIDLKGVKLVERRDVGDAHESSPGVEGIGASTVGESPAAGVEEAPAAGAPADSDPVLARFAEALTHLASDGCQATQRDERCWDVFKQRRDWCYPCVAQLALDPWRDRGRR